MSRHSKGKGFWVGTVIGSLVGGVTALLLAPKSGDKMRKDITRKCSNFSDKTHKLIGNVADQAMDLVEKAKDVASDAKDTAKDLIKEFRKHK